MVNIFVGNTDNDWFDFLARQTGVDEINFWKPSASNFNAIGEGERFAFRLKKKPAQQDRWVRHLREELCFANSFGLGSVRAKKWRSQPFCDGFSHSPL